MLPVCTQKWWHQQEGTNHMSTRSRTCQPERPKQKKKLLTTFALLNHVHCLTGLEADLRVFLSLVVGHGHILLQHHGLWAVDPWGEETGCQPPACRGTPRTTPAADYATASRHPVHRHRLTPTPCRPDQSERKLTTRLHCPKCLAI